MSRVYYVLPILSGMGWAMTGIFVRSLTDDGFDSMSVLFVRMAAGCLMLLLYFAVKGRELLKIRKKDLWIFILGGVIGNFGLSYFNVLAVKYLTMSLAATLLCASPIVVIWLAAAIFKEKITLSKCLCALMVVIGCILVSGLLEEGIGALSVVGLLAGIATTFCNALYSIFSKLAREREYNSLTLTFYFMLMVAIISAPMTNLKMVTGYISAAPINHIMYLMLYAAFVALMPYITFTFSLSRLETGKASILACSEPVAAMLYGAVFYSEVPTALNILGMAVTVISLSALVLSDKK